jgi:energy-converting hydrogenase Eha subunit G
LNNIARSIAFLGFSIAATGLALGGNNFIQGSNLLSMADVPTITWIFWMAGFATFVRGLFVITKR